MIAIDERSRTVWLEELLSGFARPGTIPRIRVHGLSLDSRRIRSGDLFLALVGHQGHGIQYHQEAVRRGASAILYDPVGGGRELAQTVKGVACIPVDSLNQTVGYIADRFFQQPSQFLDVIAVTGTNGKTSCTHFLAHALSNHRPAAVIGTLGWGVPHRLNPTDQTTPDAIEVHSLLDQLRSRSIRSVAIEASSHGLFQGRLNGVRVKAALYTNITRDHLDYHGTQEAYVEAKMRLLEFPGLETVAFNADDPVTSRIVERIPVHARAIAFSISGRRNLPVPALLANRITHEADGLSIGLSFEGVDTEIRVPVFGDYNVENVLGTLAVLLGRGYGFVEAVERLTKLRPVPGRMEQYRSREGVTAVVDYAHSPDALERVLRHLKSHCQGDLWVVFGCGGERDRGKRPLMGQVAERWADRVMVTDDNPRREDGDAIVADILAGCQGKDVTVQRDRRLAIQFAIESAGPCDVVLIAGKGHECYQDVGSRRLPFDDREVVQSLVRARGGAN